MMDEALSRSWLLLYGKVAYTEWLPPSPMVALLGGKKQQVFREIGLGLSSLVTMITYRRA